MVKRVRAAIHYQHPQAPLRLMADHALRPLRRDIKAGLAQTGKTLDMEKATFLIAAGRHYEVRDAIDWSHWREIMRQPLGRISALYLEAGQYGARKINGAFTARRRTVHFKKVVGMDFAVVEKDIGDLFNFDRFDESTQAKIRAYQDAFLTDVEGTAAETINAIIIRDLRAGLGPEEIANDIRLSVPLNTRQATALQNYRDSLEQMGTLDQSGLAAAVEQQAEAYLDQRSDMIARTEATRAASLGLQESYRQAIDRGVMPVEAVKQRWQIAMDERTCAICLSIPDMNQDGVGINESFDSIDGPIDAPGIHPNCRCSVEIITNLDLVPDEQTGAPNG